MKYIYQRKILDDLILYLNYHYPSSQYLQIITVQQQDNCMYSSAERVQFFQSQSSFESESSLTNSRFYDFTNEIISETDNVFLTLKRQLLPNEQFSQQEKVKYALTRAQLIYKDTIPQHLAYLKKISAPPNAISQISACSEKLKKLLADYDSLKNGTMIYKQFFNLYGREFGYNPEGNFNKAERVLHVDDSHDAILKPECIEISYSNDRAKLRATPRVVMAANPASNDKEVSGLREQVYLLKRNIEQIKKKHDLELTNERLTTEKRIRTYLKMPSNESENKILKQQLQNYSFKLSCAEEDAKTLKQTLEENNRTIEALTAENQSLKQQVQMLRKLDINNHQQNLHDKSYTSQMGEKEDKRLEKRLNMVTHQNELLKNQLKAERQRIYRLTSNLSDEEKKDLERLKKQVDKKNTEIEQLFADLDKQRIELLQLTHNNKVGSKMQDSLKMQNQQLKKQIKSLGKQQKSINVYPLPSTTELQHSMAQSKKLQVLEYEGEGIEGLPYYQILNKQFKIRFRRACLKDKELLYKSNGLEIGVITQFQKPNKIDMLLHLTNYGQQRFLKVKGKLMNANENRITGEVFEFTQISAGEQIKVAVSLLINHYPLGPLILLLQYQTDKKEQLRILLPAHIFKMVEFQERNQPIKNPQRITIVTERKIAKGIEEVAQYCKGTKIQRGVIKTSAFHRHTHTEIHLDIAQTKEGVDLFYQHYQGNSNITEYFVKTLQFLLRK